MPQPEGNVATRTPELLSAAVTDAGFDDVRTAQVDVVWRSPTIEDTVRQCEDVIRNLARFADLAVVPTAHLRAALRRATEPYVRGDGVCVPTTALLAAGRKR